MTLLKKTPPAKYSRSDADSWIDVLNLTEGNNAVRVRRSTSQAVATGTIVPISFDTEDFDTGGWHSSGTPTRLTAPVAGTYLAGGTVEYAIGNTTGGRYAGIRFNGSLDIAAAAADAPANAVDQIILTPLTVIRLNVGDYLELYAYQTSGSTLNVVVNSVRAPVFWLMKVLN